MSAFHDMMLAGSGGQAGGGSSYQIARSLRFNSPDSAYLSRTPSVAGNRKTWTWAGWVKRSGLGTRQKLFGPGNDAGGTYQTAIGFNLTDSIEIYEFAGGAPTQIAFKTTTAVYRDISAWMHIVLVWDTTNATAEDRIQLYVNGVRVTSFSTNANPTQNYDGNVNTTNPHDIGRMGVGVQYYSGYLADVHFIDGQALTPTSFGQFDTNNVWQPKAYSGSYGTNGFRLDFSDNSNTTAAALGADRSGNGNNWTPNNFSVTAGAGNDSLVDSPTNYGTDTGAGGEVRGNYCTLNPLVGAVGTLSNGNLDATTSTSTNHRRGTIGVSSGKWYWEFTANSSSDLLFGVVRSTASFTDPSSGYPGGDSNGWSYYQNNGNKYNGSGGAAYGASYTTGDIIGVALDADAGTLTFYKNGVSQGQAFNNVTSGPFFPAAGNGGAVDRSYSCNFGQRPFAYAAPSGFKALCSTNLPTPTIPNGRTAMDVVTYTGNSSTQSITGLGFSPDLVWLKSRSAGTGHALYDSIRGPLQYLGSESTSNELTIANTLTSLDAAGFTLGSYNGLNASATTYVGWAWDAGTSTVTNTAGTITSQVRANASAGISIVSWTGNTTNGATVGHGLGVAPSLVIYKNRSAATNWIVNATPITGTGTYLVLNGSNATASNAQYVLPTSSTLVLPSYSDTNGGSMIAYCFAPVSGFSAFGSYTGNGSADGPMVWTGFLPRWILIKATSGTQNWIVKDTARSQYNTALETLFPSGAGAEVAAGNDFDILSNGFKLRNGGGDYNTNNVTYIWAAFASNPFSIARAR